MPEALPVWVYIILSLFAGLFGNQFLGRVLSQFQAHRHTLQQAEVTHQQSVQQAEVNQQTDLLHAVVDMVKNQSAAMTELLKDALKSNQVMANNVGQLAMAIEGSGRDEHNHFLLVREGIEGVNRTLKEMDNKLAATNDYTAAVVRVLGGDLDEIVKALAVDRETSERLVEGGV